jgi:DNA-binding transcriptional MerR regulator
MKIMYIGKLSELTGASRKAIRLYEELGLIPVPKRKGQYRIYSERDVHLVSMIRRAQSVGFNLSELKEITNIKAREARFPFELAYRLILQKREQLQNEIKRLSGIDQGLLSLTKELAQIEQGKRALDPSL